MIFINNLTLGYNKHPIIHHLTTNFSKGSCTAVIGPNGGGKSTLLKGIMSFIPPMSGNVSFSIPQDSISYLPQTSTIDKTFPITTTELVASGLWKTKGLLKSYTKLDLENVNSAISKLGLEKYANIPIKALSGGQIQRALFARLYVQNTEIILLDEPFNAIDIKSTKIIYSIIEEWRKQNKTILAVLHDYSQVSQYFDHTIIISKNLLIHGTTSEVFNVDNINKAFNEPRFIVNSKKICDK